jgi:alkylhydroperoxidase family enzyme
MLIDAGENPDRLALDEREAVIVEFGRQLVKDANNISDPLYSRLAQLLTPPQIVTLTAFGALMIATNLVNNALQVDLDDYLASYRVGAR